MRCSKGYNHVSAVQSASAGWRTCEITSLFGTDVAKDPLIPRETFLSTAIFPAFSLKAMKYLDVMRQFGYQFQFHVTKVLINYKIFVSNIIKYNVCTEEFGTEFQ
jgi:hypothetical protein